jgi:hypothetical protein
MVTASYRYYNSFRDFHGSEKIPVPSPPEIYANTHVNTVDFSVTYAATDRLNFSLSLPIQHGTRLTYIEHDDGSSHTMRADGVGDLRISGNLWLLDPETHPEQNVSLGLGVKTPTGNSNAQDYSFRSLGRVLRPVDPAIQPADGGWGVILSGYAFQRVFKNTSAYFQGAYLINPREFSDTQTVYGDRPDFTGGDVGYIINSVPDQYLGRIGLNRGIWPAKGLSVSFGGRIDGVPSKDLIGGSDGFRIPGYSVSVEPGFYISRGKDLFSFTVPVAVKRHVGKTVADIRTNNPFAGIGTLADYQINMSYSRRF